MAEFVVDYGSEVVAKPSFSYRLRWCLMGLGVLVFGILSIKDGFFKYPRENEAARAKGLQQMPHPGLDIPFNRTFAVVLPPLGLLIIGWAMYNSRGKYVMTGDQLQIPGHPIVPIQSIRAIDKTLWDRKGIVYITYDHAGTAGKLKLDDYVYEHKPTDLILERIEKTLVPEGTAAETSSEA